MIFASQLLRYVIQF